MYCLVALVVSVNAQVIRQDAFPTETLVARIDSAVIDSMMLELLHKQAVEIAHRNDSIYKWRLENDTTTLDIKYLEEYGSPFHIGFRDSLMAAADRTEQRYYLHSCGLAYQPLAWTKHYGRCGISSSNAWSNLRQNPQSLFALLVNPSFDLRETNSQVTEYPNSITRVGGMFLLKPQTIVSQPFDDDMTIATIEPEKSLLPPSVEKGKKLAVNGVRNKWYKEMTIMLQLTQNYLTKNWYAGGSSSLSTLGILTGKLDYNDFNKITWENTLEWSEGATMTPSDTIRKINMTEDMLKVYSKFNFKAYNKIYYSMSGEFITQFFDTYKEAKSTTLVTTTFSPIRVNLNVGMDFKPVKGLSIAVSPLSFKYVYVSDTTRIKQTDFSVPVGANSLKELGSSLRVEYSYKPVREFSLDSKLYFYTNYSKVEFDMEIIANLIFSQYFSARVSLHPRYDNTVVLSGDERAKFQFKEFVSVGFTHRFR